MRSLHCQNALKKNIVNKNKNYILQDDSDYFVIWMRNIDIMNGTERRHHFQKQDIKDDMQTKLDSKTGMWRRKLNKQQMETGMSPTA